MRVPLFLFPDILKKFDEETRQLSENKDKYYTFNLDYIKLQKVEDAYCVSTRFFLFDMESKLVCSKAEQIADLLYGRNPNPRQAIRHQKAHFRRKVVQFKRRLF